MIKRMLLLLVYSLLIVMPAQAKTHRAIEKLKSLLSTKIMFPGYTVEDTAAWIAAYRAIESKREDALFVDKQAAQLLDACNLKKEIMKDFAVGSFAMIAIRTKVLDDFLSKYIALHQIEMVVNIGAGYDTRPYRLDLQENLSWIEIDLPEVINFKTQVLKHERPRCSLERHSYDMANQASRNRCFEYIAQAGKKTLVLTEALLLFLSEQEVRAFSHDLFQVPTVSSWLLEYCTQSFIDYANPLVAQLMLEGKAPFRFGVPDDMGTAFFEPLGWRCLEQVHLLSEVHALEHKRGEKISYASFPPEAFGVALLGSTRQEW